MNIRSLKFQRSTISCAFSCVLAASVAMSANAATLTWTGGGGDGKWSTADNWDSTPDWSQVNDLDFTALGDGSSVVNDATTKFGTLTLGESKGTITIKSSGKNVIGTMSLVIPSGTTLDAQFQVSSGWSWNSWALTANGGGTLLIDSSWQAGYCAAPIVLDNVTTRIKKELGAQQAAYFTLKNGATLTADTDFSWGNIRSESNADVFDLNGHSISLLNPSGTFNGKLKGTGKITLSGGGNWTLVGVSDEFTGTIVQKTALVTFSGNGCLGTTARLVNSDTGRTALAADQTVASLSGQAAIGGVTIPAGKTLTVTGVESGDSSTYGARLSGDGNFTLNAPGKTMVLSGANALTGKTTVQAGKLIVRSAPNLSGYPSGLVHRYSFDGDIFADDLGANDLEVESGCAPVQRTDGIGGTGCVRFNGTDSTKWGCLQTKANTFISGKKPFSIVFWYREEGNLTWSNSGTIITTGGPWSSDEKSRAILGSTKSGNDCYVTLQGNWVWLPIWTGDWNQIALVFDGTNLSLYRNGTYNQAKTKEWDIIAGKLAFGYKTNADYDEMLVFNRALEASEVKSLYSTPHPAPTTTDLRRLPEPIAHWAFDDAENPGKDTSGNGYDLSVEGGTLSLTSGSSTYGKAAVITKSGAYLKWSGIGLPAKFPRGNSSFTVHVRMTGTGEDQGVDLFSMGDVTTAGKAFRIANGNYPRILGYDTTKTSGDSGIDISGWLSSTFYYDYTIVYDADSGTLTSYRDGVLQNGPTTATADIDGDGTIYIAYNPKKTTHFVSNIDDLQVFNKALDAQQVRHLVQSLETGAMPPAISPKAEVSVAEGATLQFVENGELVVSLSRPAIAGAGTVMLPKSMKVSFAESANEIYAGTANKYPIVQAAEIVGPVDLSTWTITPQSDDYQVTLVRDGNTIYAKVKRRGFILILK